MAKRPTPRFRDDRYTAGEFFGDVGEYMDMPFRYLGDKAFEAAEGLPDWARAGVGTAAYTIPQLLDPTTVLKAAKVAAPVVAGGLGLMGLMGRNTGPVSTLAKAKPGQMGSIGSETSQLGKTGADLPAAPITEEVVPSGQRISTASPTPAQAEKIGFHTRDDLHPSLEMMQTNPEKFAKNMSLMSAYMPSRARNPYKRGDEFLEQITGNLDYLAENAPRDFVERSGNWYKGARNLANDMSQAYGTSAEANAAVLARLSPGMDWFQNVEQADRLVDLWTNARGIPLPDEAFDIAMRNSKGKASKLRNTRLEDLTDPQDKATWLRAFDEATTPGHFKSITPEGALSDDVVRTKAGKPAKLMWQSNTNLAKAIDILENPSVENISRNMGKGHKIRNFYNNIISPFSPGDVTIDTHAVSAGLLTPYSQKGIPVGHAFGGGAVPGVVEGSARSGLGAGTYGLYADAYRQAADNQGVIPQALQSPTWELIRETFPTSGAQKAQLQQQIEPIWKMQKKGLMTPQGARDAIIDIATQGQGLMLPPWYGQ